MIAAQLETLNQLAGRIQTFISECSQLYGDEGRSLLGLDEKDIQLASVELIKSINRLVDWIAFYRSRDEACLEHWQQVLNRLKTVIEHLDRLERLQGRGLHDSFANPLKLDDIRDICQSLHEQLSLSLPDSGDQLLELEALQYVMSALLLSFKQLP